MIIMKIDGMDALVTRVLDNVYDNDNANSLNSKTVTPLKEEGGDFSAQSVHDKGENANFEKSVVDAVDKINKALSNTGRELKFLIHKETKEIMVQVLDSETKEVIREIPPQKVLDMVAKLWEMAGILVDERR